MFKKLGLFILFGFILVRPAFADIDLSACPAYSADSTVTHFNSCRSAYASWAASQVQGSGTTGATTNIKSRSLGELDMANEINPRVRDSELFNITFDSVSAGVLNQRTVVETGCVPATASGLTSTISACVSYVNGYRVSVSATSETYTNTMDTYVDLSQNGVYTLTAVSSGATQPAVAANSIRLAKVVTSGGNITSVTSLFTTRVPGLIIPANYRNGLYVSRDSSGTVSIFPGSAEINNAMVSKTGTTILTLATPGDWAGASSLQAISTYGYVGMDSSGNIKLHTTAPAFSDYAVSNAVGKKRYSTWSATVYRILGWFYMNATGSGQLNTYEVGNIKEGDVPNFTATTSSTDVNSASIAFAPDTQATMHFYSSGNPMEMKYNVGGDDSTNDFVTITNDIDSAGISSTETMFLGNAGAATKLLNATTILSGTYSQGTHTIQPSFKVISGTGHIYNRTMSTEEK